MLRLRRTVLVIGLLTLTMGLPVVRSGENPLTTGQWSLTTVSAQSAAATLSGTVEDEKGAVIAGVDVTITNVGTALQRRAKTNGDGYFTIPLLPPGTYSLRAEREGFAPVETRNIILNVNDQRAMHIQLKVGAIGTTVNVVNEASLIDESPAVATVVDRQFVANLPLNGRSFQSLISLSPGAVLTKATDSEPGQFSVNGQRANANYFTVDGVSANVGVATGILPGQQISGSLPGFSVTGGSNNLVSVDALQEFRIQTSTYAPEFGRTPGGQVQIITRGGTNTFTGTVFEYFRNDALDANDWFANRSGAKRPPLRQNDFGGVMGGRIIKDQTFFFVSYEGLRLRQPQFKTRDVPSLAARQSAPAAVKPFLDAFPVPNGPVNATTNFGQFFSSYSDGVTLSATSVRIDHKLNDKLSLFGRYGNSPSENVTRGGLGGTIGLSSIGRTQVNTQTLTLSATWLLNSQIINDLRFNYSRNRGESVNEIDNFGGAVVPADSALFPSFAPTDASLFQLILLEGNGASIHKGPLSNDLQRQVNLVDGLSVVSGAHQLKFGIDYRRLFPVISQQQYAQQIFFFGVSQALAGTATFDIISGSSGPRFPVLHNLSMYGQDTWKLDNRLTLTYGLRWEFNPPASEKNKNFPAVVTGLDNPSALALAPFGTKLYRTTYSNFAPRIGIGYQFGQTPGRETVLRGGFGLFYDLGNGQSANVFGPFFPYATSITLQNVALPLTTAQATPPALSNTPPFGQLFAFDPNLKLPRTYQWNVAVEQSLGASQTVSASYVAAVGRRLLRQEVINSPEFSSRLLVTRNNATSDYHALQLQFERRLFRGLQALASYTWSKSLDNISNDSSSNAPEGKVDVKHERGPSDFDVRHAFSAAVTYNLPTPRLGAFSEAILGRWSVDTVFRSRTATPVNIVTGADPLISGASRVYRPDLIAGIPLYLDDPSQPRGRRVNPAAFSAPAGRQGTLGRNALRGFPFWQLDLSLRRQFDLTERTNLQLKADFFNLFNHPNFADPNGILNQPSTFGRSTSMLGRNLGGGGVFGGFNALYQVGGPRSIQLALKLNF
jgi:hypothetical protein